PENRYPLMPRPTLELTLRDERPFAIATYPPGASYGPRVLRNWEFVWMLEGDAVYTRADQTAEAPEGSLVLCRPGATDFFRWDPVHSTRHAYFHFELDGDFPSAWPDPDRWPLVRCPSGDTDLLRPLFRNLMAWGNQGDAVQRQLIALSLVAAFVTGESESGSVRSVSTSRPQYPEPVERALAYISSRLETDPAGALSLGDIAEAAFVTPEHLCRLFKAATGTSPSENVRLARLDRSVTLLCRTNFTVTEIAALCGFASPFHFSRRFKDAFGQSPRALRDAVASGAIPAPLSRRAQTYSTGPFEPTV
ncbi:MAG: helix-turn-helix transcriptional regulator, partial [Armatimonadota bacterium]